MFHNLKMNIPEEVGIILKTLQQANFEAYVVGGCVRDALLGREANDFDVTTNAEPHEIKELFTKTIDTGLKHGTVTVRINHKSYEVTTFRIDGEYLDNRHPESVTFTKSLKEDLRRRDFTINAFAYNDKDGLVDYFDGLNDLKNKVIRSIDDPYKRFNEDGLRILRAIRFSAQLGFEIEDNTKKAMKELSYLLKNISKERIRDEFVKILMSEHPEKLNEARELGLTKYFLSDFDILFDTKQENPHHIYDVGRHTIEAIKVSKKDLIIRLSLLFHDFGKPGTKTYDKKGIAHFYKHAILSENLANLNLKSLKFPNLIIKEVCFLIAHHDDIIVPKEKYVRRAINKISPELFPLLLEIRRCDIMAQSDLDKEKRLNDNKLIEEYYLKIMKNEDCLSLKDLAVNGDDLKSLGFKGKEIGKILSRMLDVVIDEPNKNSKNYLLSNIEIFK